MSFYLILIQYNLLTKILLKKNINNKAFKNTKDSL